MSNWPVHLAGGPGEVQRDHRVLGESVPGLAVNLPVNTDPMTAAGFYPVESRPQRGYDPPRPGEFISRWARMPLWFSLGIQRIQSVMADNFLPAKDKIQFRNTVAMANRPLPPVTQGWPSGPRQNIAPMEQVTYGSLAVFDPEVYGTSFIGVPSRFG